jgi:hypothetical protein
MKMKKCLISCKSNLYMQIEMKPFLRLIIASLLFPGACKEEADQRPMLVDFSSLTEVNNSLSLPPRTEQFGCGTFSLKYYLDALDEWEDKNPGRTNKVSFLAKKKNVLRFFDVFPNYSLELSSFDRSGIADFYIPKTPKNWPTIIYYRVPADQICYIKQANTESIPLKVSVSVGLDAWLTVELHTDSTLTRKLSQIIIKNRLGKIKYE